MKFNYVCYCFTCSLLADAFIQSDLEMRTMEAIKINKRVIELGKCLQQASVNSLHYLHYTWFYCVS